MHNLVIRDAKIVGGSGAPAVYGDVAVDDGIVLQVDGAKAATGKREINAHGAFLAPGWVDVHTHYDGQATWDPYLSPSSWHGVTMAVMGNLRPYMMGLNGIESNDANAQEIEEMRRLTREALVAGALGFSTSRTLIHKGADGKHVPGTFARLEEIFGIGKALGDAHRGVFQMTSTTSAWIKKPCGCARLPGKRGNPRPLTCNRLIPTLSYGKHSLRRLKTPGARGCRATERSAGGRWVCCFRGAAPFIPLLRVRRTSHCENFLRTIVTRHYAIRRYARNCSLKNHTD